MSGAAAVPFRKIVHIDMDCYYAAIECRDDPSVVDKPVGVGGSSGRGVLTTCNYIARSFGCRSAMPVFKALQLCPQLVLKPVRFSVYREETQRIRSIFADYTDLVETLSLDEAYLDLSLRIEYAWDLAKQIRARIFKETHLTASAGISFNKMLAKIASDWRKPDGQFAILPGEVHSFMAELPVGKLWGIGPKTTKRLVALGFETCGQLQALSLDELGHYFGPKSSAAIYQLSRGIDDRLVQTERRRKSMSVERTFSVDLPSLEACEAELPDLIEDLREDLQRRESESDFTKVFVKLKFNDFQRTTKEQAGTELSVHRLAPLLKEAFERRPLPVRLMGIGVRFPEPVEPAQAEQLELPLEMAPYSEAGFSNPSTT